MGEKNIKNSTTTVMFQFFLRADIIQRIFFAKFLFVMTDLHVGLL